MSSTAFGKITAVYGHIDENGRFVRKRTVPKMAITDKMVKNSCLSVKIQVFLIWFYGQTLQKPVLSVNPHHNGQKFTDKSHENDGLSVKCVFITDKSAKIGALSVNLSEILAHCPKKKKSVPSRHEFSSLFSCVRGHERSLPHLHNRVQTSNKAHDKFVPRRDCACADHSRPSLSTALLSGWSSHLVNHPRQPIRPSLRFEHALNRALFAKGW